jgi:hypothetical protein
MSFGQYAPDSGLQQRCTDAYQNNIVLVAAAGNGNVEDWSGYPSYPAGYSNVLAVAAVDSSDVRSVWGGIDPTTGKTQASNYGTWIDISAPGTGIWTANYSGSYSASNGTSFASPIVAGVASLVLASNPGLTNQEVYDRIKNTADDIDALQQPAYQGKMGAGRINAADAVAGVTADITSPQDGDYVTGTVDIYGTARGWNFSSYEVVALKGSTIEVNIKSSTSQVDAGLLGSWNTSGKDGPYSIRLTVYSTSGSTDESVVSFFVDNTIPLTQISSPAAGATVEGVIDIIGTASDQYLDRYVVEYGQGIAPSTYQTIGIFYSGVTSGTLTSWETVGLSGNYMLRLTAYDKVGASAAATRLIYISAEAVQNRGVVRQDSLPMTYALPNPFDRSLVSSITFNYSLTGNFDTKIYLFDLSGNLIWQQSFSAGENGGKAGTNDPLWNGSDLFGSRVANGIYVYQIVAGNHVIGRGKVIVLN